MEQMEVITTTIDWENKHMACRCNLCDTPLNISIESGSRVFYTCPDKWKDVEMASDHTEYIKTFSQFSEADITELIADDIVVVE